MERTSATVATSSPAHAAIPLSRPCTGEAELAAVAAVLESGWLAGQGPRSTLLETRFRELTGRRHAVAVTNCTAGLHLSLLALGVGPGDEVVVADYSFPATAHAVLYCGARPVFADVRPDTGTIDPSEVARLATGRTRGVIGVDALGVPADWDDLREATTARRLFLLEDAACAAGGTYRGRPCGAFGDVAVFSLHARKGITCGEGGVVVTDDDEVAARVRRAACFGMASALARESASGLPVAQFAELGWNYKLSDVLAAIAVVQTERLAPFLAERRALAARYGALLAGVPHVGPPRVPADREPTWQTYAVTLEPPLDRDAIGAALRERGVGCTIGTYAMHREPVYGHGGTALPASARLFERHLALPMFNGLTAADQDRVVEALAGVVAARLRSAS